MGLRRAFDVVGATLLLAATSPLLLAAAAAVYLDTGRPIFFGHWRVGKGGRPFRCWKFRTMRAGAESHLDQDAALRNRYRANDFKIPTPHDPRVTRVGRWLRRTYLDEIPQLLNVLAGTMALVGPRPVVRDELGQFEPHVAELLAVKPGVFSPWASLGVKRPPYPARAALELDYARRRSVRRDLGILVRSVGAVLRGEPES